MRKRLFILIPLVVILSAALAFGGLSLYKKYVTSEKVHNHAGFQVYVDGQLQDFSDTKFMKENPCIDDNENSHVEEDEQLEKAHLHDRNGKVIHLHRNNVFWSDFFANIRYVLSKNKETKSFVNRKEVEDILEEKINPYDSVVIFIGENQDIDEKLKNDVKKDEILKAEQKSESCGS